MYKNVRRLDKLKVNEYIVTSSHPLNRTITEKMKRISKEEVARACTLHVLRGTSQEVHRPWG